MWLLLGLAGGIAAARNAEPMANPAGGAVVLVLLVGCALCWVAGYRGKSTAVAVAVAHATAVASAAAEAQAAAIAQAAVHLHMEQLPQAITAAAVEHQAVTARTAPAIPPVHQVGNAPARLWLPEHVAR